MSLAARGARNMDTGVEKIADEEIKKTLRRQARRVYLESIVAGLVLAAILVIMSG